MANIKDIDYNKDYYGILGVSKDASESDIKKAYRKLSLKWHPDKHTSDSDEDKKVAEEKFKEVNDAYSILGDQDMRNAYDEGPMAAHGGFNPFGGFGFGFGGPHQRPVQRGETLKIDLYVSFQDLVNGIKDRTIKYKRNVRCDDCHGYGGTDAETCPVCKGTGQSVRSEMRGNTIYQTISTCEACHGKGRTIKNVCKTCHGTGMTERDEEQTISINADNLMHNHAQGRMGPLGHQSPDENGPDGELVFEIVHDLPEGIEIITTNDRNFSIMHKVGLPYYEFMLGTKYEVDTPSGKKSVNIPSNCRRTLRLNGMGLNIRGYKGDYLIKPFIDTAYEPSDKERRLLEQIRDLHVKS